MKKAIIIGASSGMGWELARILGAQGYQLGLMARREAPLLALAASLPGEARMKVVDVSTGAAAGAELAQFANEMGGVDLIIISAGTGDLNPELDWSLEHDAIATNVTGFASLAGVAITHFMQRGVGHLVGISSIAALRGSRSAPAYNASKAFQTIYLEGLRQKVRQTRQNIHVTDIRPGFVKTDMAKGDGIFWAAEPDKAARQIYRVIGRRSRVAYVTKRWRMIAWLMRTLPNAIHERM